MDLLTNKDNIMLGREEENISRFQVKNLDKLHKNIRIDETARGQLMTYTRQFLVFHPWNNPIFSHPTCHPYPYSDQTIF